MGSSQTQCRKHSKKKIVIISVSVAIVLAMVLGMLIWYFYSPFPTVLKLLKAAGNRDVDLMLECIEPEKANMMRMLLSYLDVDIGDLLNTFGSEGNGFVSKPNMKFQGYHRDGDKAFFEFDILDGSGNVTGSNRIYFIRLNGKWYLSLSF